MSWPSGSADGGAFRRKLEEQLSRVSSQVADPKVGLYGPDSMVWSVNREALIFLGSGRAALLQLAHPFVADAIERYSNTRSDPFGRFHRTFRIVFAMVYGDLEAACEAARRVGRVHMAISGVLREGAGEWPAGHAYSATDEQALLWVHATLWETSVLVYESFVRALSPDEKERYYRETRLFAHLFGIDDAALPPTWADFESYNRDMWSRLEPTPAAREIGSFLFEPHGFGTGPAFSYLRAVTAALMPAPLRAGFGLPVSRSGEGRSLILSFTRVLVRTRRLWPRRVRFVPPYLEALRRIEGDERRDFVGEWLLRLWLGESR